MIYKERAYEKFMRLIHEMEHRVVKGLLTAKPREASESIALEETLLAKYQDTGVEGFLGNPIPEVSSQLSGNKEGALAENILLQNPSGIRVTRVSPEKPKNTEYPVVGRNDPCPCGSGKKYKQCHGA